MSFATAFASVLHAIASLWSNINGQCSEIVQAESTVVTESGLERFKWSQALERKP